MKVRLMGTEHEVKAATERLRGVFVVLQVSDPYRCRGDSQLVRVYVEVQV
jgi:hypothetical protein